MNKATLAKVRTCLAEIKPGLDLSSITDDTPLLEERVITSFDVLNLILHLEHISGCTIAREQLVPGSFRNVRTIAEVFLARGESK